MSTTVEEVDDDDDSSEEDEATLALELSGVTGVVMTSACLVGVRGVVLRTEVVGRVLSGIVVKDRNGVWYGIGIKMKWQTFKICERLLVRPLENGLIWLIVRFS